MALLDMADAITMATAMARQADEDADLADRDDDGVESAYWNGWSDGLHTLVQHIRTDVKVSCFPIGSCTCHPFKLEGR